MTNRYLLRLAAAVSAAAVMFGAASCGTMYMPEIPEALSVSEAPEYSGMPYAVINGNEPEFGDDTAEAYESFEYYSRLDMLGRCGTAYASLSTDTMPTEERGNISEVKPSGWQTVTYDFIDGEHLYNRCHLIGFQLSGENANERNLITGTRYMNTEGMLPFENEVAEYIDETGNHVLYRVEPVFEGTELVARGVHMEAESVEDGGEGVSFNVYCYNVQPGVEIDYSTGESYAGDAESAADEGEAVYILNKSSKKYHSPDCPGAQDMSGKNRAEFTGTEEELRSMGYTPCGQCIY